MMCSLSKISNLYSSEIFAFFPKNSIILTIQNFLKIQRGYRMGYTVAVVGATGAVGSQMIKMLEESSLPIDKIRYLASARSAGKVFQFKGQDITIEETTETAFEGVDIALFSAGGSTSAKFAPYAVKAGAVVVDNTSYFRQNPDVPGLEGDPRQGGAPDGLRQPCRPELGVDPQPGRVSCA